VGQHPHLRHLASALTEQEQTAARGEPYGSVRDTLAHIIGAQMAWLARWTGAGRPSEEEFEALRTAEGLREGFRSSHEGLRRFVEALTEEQVVAPLSYKDSRGNPYSVSLWQLMAHVANHGTQHRSETAMVLTQLGRSPGDLDYIYFELTRQGRR
jgi:uncharacterized damage-inducible protein DinB